jgi:hypothetical protein
MILFMKKIIFAIIFSLSILGNIITIAVLGFMFYQVGKVLPSGNGGLMKPWSGSGNAIVNDVISIDIDGYKSSHIIATYEGHKIVMENIRGEFDVKEGYMEPNPGDSIKVLEMKFDAGGAKAVRYMVDVRK